VSAAAVNIRFAMGIADSGIYSPAINTGSARLKLASHSTGKVTRWTNTGKSKMARPQANVKTPTAGRRVSNDIKGNATSNTAAIFSAYQENFANRERKVSG